MKKTKGKIILVGCVATKQEIPCAAKDMYISPLFKKRRAYAEQEVKNGNAASWFIVSSLHTIIDPETVIEPYDKTMKHWGQDSLYWARCALTSLGNLCCKVWGTRISNKSSIIDHTEIAMDNITVEIHAGEDYVKPILAVAERDKERFVFEWPVKGLQIGQSLKYYDDLINRRKSKRGKSGG